MSGIVSRGMLGVYRALPISGAARRKLRAAVLAPFLRGKEPFVHDWRGMKIMLDPAQSIDMRLYFSGDYEPETLDSVKRLAPEGGTVIDVGANIGLISIWAASCVGSAGRVIAIEPSGWSSARLRKNAELNGLAQVELVQAACGESAGSLSMPVINGYRVDDVDTTTLEDVPMVSIDQLVAERGLTRLDLIKTDTDGYEMSVLRGARDTIAKFHPAIVFEVAPTHLLNAGSSIEEVLTFLEGEGYSFFDERFAPADARATAAAIGTNDSTNLIALVKPAA